MKDLIYETSVESEEDLLTRVMAAVDIGLPGIGDRVYQNIVYTYHVCDEVDRRNIESSSKCTQNKNNAQ